MDYAKLARLLYPEVTGTVEELELRFPPRKLPEGALVTRFAPSPTGFMHIGNLFGALCDERLAHQSGGVFMLRIEDTDAKRAVAGGVEAIIDSFAAYDLRFDEGAVADGGDKGDYGPYRQSERAEIYHIVAKKLVAEGKAYPCFCTEEQLGLMRSEQEACKANPGYYGRWARCRELSLEEIEAKLDAGIPFVLRFRSGGDPERRFTVEDLNKGHLALPENDCDHVMLKSDGIPTYHFAHVVDDHFMRTSIVVRGDEWLATLPYHVQMFDALGWPRPVYLHTSPVNKLDGDSKRKLSKRKDPEASLLDYYAPKGYPTASVMEYLLTILNSNFEEWRTANPGLPYTDFPFTAAKMSVSGALFDIAKLYDVSRGVMCAMPAGEASSLALRWAERFAPDFYAVAGRDPDYLTAVLAVGRGGDKPRKDIGRWDELPEHISYMYDETFGGFEPELIPDNLTQEAAKAILAAYIPVHSTAGGSADWFERCKDVAEKVGFARETKLFRKNPGVYPGHVGDVCMVLRTAVTGRCSSIDLYSVMCLLGEARTLERLRAAMSKLS